MYTFTYLDTAAAMNHLLSDIVSFERERLTAITEASIRTQDYVRADRSSWAAYLSELATTDMALTMHFNQFQGDDSENAYLQLTPMALRRSIGMLAMLRQAAQAESDYYFELSHTDGLDGEDIGNLRNMASDSMAFDFFFYGKACEMNEACIAYGTEILS
jgi:hypothetical protein